MSLGASERVPFVRYGAVANHKRVPASNQWYYAFEEDEGPSLAHAPFRR